ncbi:hypothetical protein M1N92_04395 [Dehalococcoidia bacterium]|nr:hypothetical protein [Dehalococcoidia bacterium]
MEKIINYSGSNGNKTRTGLAADLGGDDELNLRPQMVINSTVNHLTSDLAGDHGGGSIYNSTLLRLAPLSP